MQQIGTFLELYTLLTEEKKNNYKIKRISD